MSTLKPSFVPVQDEEDPAEVARRLALPKTTHLTPDEAFQYAQRLHRDGRLDGAHTLYQRLLEADPGQVDVMALLGVVEHQLGRSESGLAHLRRAVEACPDRAGFHLNLGNVLLGTERFDEALGAYRRAAELEPSSPDVSNNMGAAYRALDCPDEARAAYRHAIALDPKNARAWNNLGLLHDAQGDLEQATHAYLTAIDLLPGQGMSAYLLGMTFYKAKRIDKATEVFRQWMVRDPGNPVPSHLFAACSGQNVPDRAPDNYIEAEFDTFAASFERVLNDRLHYRAPQLCADLLAETLGPAAGSLDMLDAGCGTGLCGPLVAPWARQLVGVDLSGGMLAKARSKGVYAELVKAELGDYLRRAPACWDAIICADTLCYFGALHEVMRAAAQALRPGGVMVYTVEALPDDQASLAVIQPNGRYSHGRAHLDQVSEAAGLIVKVARRDVLRDEAGAEVQGWLMAVQRPA